MAVVAATNDGVEDDAREAVVVVDGPGGLGGGVGAGEGGEGLGVECCPGGLEVRCRRRRRRRGGGLEVCRPRRGRRGGGGGGGGRGGHGSERVRLAVGMAMRTE